MKYFFTQVFSVVCLIALSTSNLAAKAVGSPVYKESFVYAVTDTPDSPPAPKPRRGDVQDTTSNANNGTGGKVKDSQNQTQFLKPDMDAKDYNYYDRKKISTPLMPRYDLDSAVYQKGFKKKEAQQKSFIDNKYRYPARPKDQWVIGLQGGSFLIEGDIRPDLAKAWGGGLTVRKAINYYFSVRFSYIYAQSSARDLTPRQDVEFDGALNGQLSNADYYHQNGIGTPIVDRIIFHNYKTSTHHVSLDGILNLGNVLFHRERNIVNVNLFAGIGAHLNRTQMDMLDKNGKIYDFSTALNDYYTMKATNAKQADINKKVNEDLDKILQGNYSVDAVHSQKGSGTKIGKYSLIPDVSVGVGLDFHVSKWVTLGIDERYIYNNNSDIDGVAWQDDGHPGFSPHYDHYFSTMIHVDFQLGKHRVEPLYWLNPMDYQYKRISEMNPDKIKKDLAQDTDEDGVPDYLDKEPKTKKGCPVDVKGVILDSDKDGIPDCDDKEPFSPPGYPIDANGVAQIPPNPCCDNAATGGANESEYVIDPATGKPYENAKGDKIKVGPADQEWAIDPATGQPFLDKNGNKVKNPAYGNPNYGKGIAAGGGKKGMGGRGTYDCSKIEMPGVFFEDDKYYIDPAYYSALHQVAEKLQMCPDVRMVVTGESEENSNQKYNEQLAYNRASSVVDYLVEKYGISRDRFMVKYNGGKKPASNLSPSERKQKRKVDFNYAGEGDKGESNPPAPHPGLKAGSNK